MVGCFSLRLSKVKGALTPRGMQCQPSIKRPASTLNTFAPKDTGDLGMDIKTQSYGMRDTSPCPEALVAQLRV